MQPSVDLIDHLFSAYHRGDEAISIGFWGGRTVRIGEENLSINKIVKKIQTINNEIDDPVVRDIINVVRTLDDRAEEKLTRSGMWRRVWTTVGRAFDRLFGGWNKTGRDEVLDRVLGDHLIKAVSMPDAAKGLLFGSACPKPNEVDLYKKRGIDTVFVLTPQDELLARNDGVDLIACYQEKGIDVVHAPIQDFSIPTLRDLSTWIDALDAAIASGKKVVVQCGAGKGRTGLILASYYIKNGLTPEAAIQRVRESIPGAVETKKQEALLGKYHQLVHQGNLEEIERGLFVEAVTEEVMQGVSEDRLNALLIDAFQREDPSMCRWLLSKGAKVATLDAIVLLTAQKETIRAWLATFDDTIKVHAVSDLDHLAIQQGYGFKSANLMLLQSMAEVMNSQATTCTFGVPPFIPVSNLEVAHHLRLHAPEIFPLWETFVASFHPEQVQAFQENPFLAQVDISMEGEELLKTIREKIEKAFIEHPLDTPSMREWIAREHPAQLIIRSTGKEDSDQLANAGGNESIPFVAPRAPAISENIGKVVSSYFSMRSIGQRLIAKDQSLFKDPPFMPVLIQSMVIEQEGDPLRSGVLFSRPIQEFPDLVQIQTGLGNNHGIVSCEVAVDTYFVERGNVQAVVRDKQERFVHKTGPDGKTVLVKAANDKETATTQALPTGVVQEMALAADYISLQHGQDGQKKSMDMEYSVQMGLNGKPTVFLLQARPLMDVPASPNPPSYLHPIALSKVPKEDSVNGTTLLSGHSSVQSVTAESQVIVADDLPSALQAYLKAPNQQEIRAVITRKTAPETSHEAVTFRPTGIPVIVISDIEDFEKARALIHEATAANPIKISPQNREKVVATAHTR